MTASFFGGKESNDVVNRDGFRTSRAANGYVAFPHLGVRRLRAILPPRPSLDVHSYLTN